MCDTETFCANFLPPPHPKIVPKALVYPHNNNHNNNNTLRYRQEFLHSYNCQLVMHEGLFRLDAHSANAPIDWASGEIRKTTTSFVYEQSKTLRTRSTDLIIAVNTPKSSGLNPAPF